MNAEIIAVGSELLTPQRVDTNSLYLTGELNKLGVEVTGKCVAGDIRERLAHAVRGALSRERIVIVTGGLGPTEDDVTREAVAAALDRKLVFLEDVNRQIEQRFARMKRRAAEINRRQAFVIHGAEVLTNENGTAPGQWIEESGAYLMLLPGPPDELKPMFERQCLPRLARVVPKQVIRTVTFRVVGMAESELDQLISPVYGKYENPSTTILAAGGEIQVHLRARCNTAEDAEALLAEVAAPIAALLGDRAYSKNGEALEEVIGSLLRERGATLVVAESCTGGMVAERITSVEGSSKYFLGGFITYTNRMKAKLLGASLEQIETTGPVSAETAKAMAAGARNVTGADYALSVTGVAGPGPSDGSPAGLVYIGIADGAGCEATERRFLGDRHRVRSFATQIALDLLRRRLLGL